MIRMIIDILNHMLCELKKTLWILIDTLNRELFYICVDFETIAIVDAKGDSNTPTAYDFVDIEAREGANFYRLLDTNNDGETRLASDVIVLNRSTADISINVYPVPASDVLFIQMNATANQTYTMQVHNLLGKFVAEQSYNTETGTDVFELDITAFSAGTYFISMSNGETVEVVKFIKH